MKQPIRFFAYGLLTASIIIIIFINFFQSDSEAMPSTDEMIEVIKEEGYHVITQEEYISLSVKADANGEEVADEEKPKDEAKDKKEKEQNKDESEPNEDDIHTYTLTVKENMLGPDISKLLAENKIIKDADEFTKYIDKKGYAPYIQLGDHKLTSEMNHYEIAETITK